MLRMAMKARICSGGSVIPLSFRHSLVKHELMPFSHSHSHSHSHSLSFDRIKSPNLLRFVAMAAKKNPKRLKYSTPRFTKDDGLLYIEADPSGVDSWKLEPVIELLKKGAVGVIPTDTVYALVCDLKNQGAIERLRRIKNIEPSKPLSILCRSLQDIDTYSMGFPRGDGHGHTNIFRVVKHCVPGPNHSQEKTLIPDFVVWHTYLGI